MTTAKSALNPAQRGVAIAALKGEKFDVLVIGGGVTGSGIALDAASRGLKVALVESSDLASGTSSRSSKLIHGGLRYLEQYDFKLVREALQERELMVTTQAPHLVKPVAFLYPLHEKVKERTYVGAGLALYDALRGFQRALPNHKHMSQKGIHEVAPALRLDIVTGGIQYFDAQVDDARHTMMIARTAAEYGATIVTQARVESLLRLGKRVIGAKVLDRTTGETIDVSAAVTIMAGGVWSDLLHEKFGITPGYQVRMSKGTHIVVPKSAIKSKSGIILKTAVSVLFIIPWGDKWIVGTTDTEFTGDRNQPLATREDVDYILAQANKVLNPMLKPSDVLGVYAGLRPLVSKNSISSTTKLSREHIVDHPVQGFVSIAGGKYTTYRVMAEDAVDHAAPDLRRIVPDSVTKELPILGATGYQTLVNRADLIAAEMKLTKAQVIHLLDRYGSEISELEELMVADPSLREPLNNELPYLRAEIHFAASHEGALSVADVIARRTRISFETADHGLSVAADVAKIIAPILGWSAAAKKKSIAEYQEQVATEKESVARLTTRGSASDSQMKSGSESALAK
ncbi:MAG: glycerol-3-phosphate dehydrogenase/oxidase [Actinomycetes bacterium]